MQPEYFVNVLSGTTVQGSGPIVSVSEWTVTKRMDAAGSWSFRMSAADAQAAQVVLKRNVKIYAYLGTAYVLVGSGIIDKIERQVDLSGGESLVISGGDDLRELTYRNMLNSKISTAVTVAAGAWSFQGSIPGSSATLVRSVVISDAGTGVAATNDGWISTSSDFGATWAVRDQLGAETDTSLVWADQNTAGTYYATTPGGNIYVSTDYGTNWALKAAWAPSVQAIYTSNYYIMGLGGHIYRYSLSMPDALATWLDEGALGTDTTITALAYSSTTIIAGVSPTGTIYRSTDTGDTWTAIGALGFETGVTALAVNGTTVIAGTTPNGKIYRSTDTGATWTSIRTPGGEATISTLVYVGSDVFIAGTGPNGKIWRSIDNGLSWSEVASLGTGQITSLLEADTDGYATIDSSINLFIGEDDTVDGPSSHADAVAVFDTYFGSWTFTPDGSPGNDEIFIQFAGESVLAAALMVAERSGTHCYLSATQTLTFTDTWTDSGVHLVAPVGGVALDAAVGAILSMVVMAQSYDIVTRIYPYGKSSGGTQIGIATANVADPTGYTINEADNCVIHDATEATYGAISRYVVYDDVKIDDDAISRTAANALVQAALNDLSKRISIVTNYSIQVGGLSVLLAPMQTVRITYTGDTVIDEDLYILESTWRGDDNGMATVSLVVSDVPVKLQSEAEIIAETIARVAKVAAR